MSSESAAAPVDISTETKAVTQNEEEVEAVAPEAAIDQAPAPEPSPATPKQKATPRGNSAGFEMSNLSPEMRKMVRRSGMSPSTASAPRAKELSPELLQDLAAKRALRRKVLEVRRRDSNSRRGARVMHRACASAQTSERSFRASISDGDARSSLVLLCSFGPKGAMATRLPICSFAETLTSAARASSTTTARRSHPSSRGR